MARPKSETKRTAILAGAVTAIAEAGIGASTWTIAKKARVSEGTVFIYFPTKDELLNEVYVELRKDATATVMTGFPARGTTAKRIRHFWTRGLAWAMDNPEKHRAVAQLRVWNGLTAESVKRGNEANPRLLELIQEMREEGHGRELPDELLIAASAAMQQMTIDLTLLNPKKAALYREAGLDILMSGVLR